VSYDIRIMKATGPYEDPGEQLDVSALVEAINTFPPFAKRRVTWSNQRWNEYPEWQGLTIDLEDWHPPPSEPRPGTEHRAGGQADACEFHVSYGAQSDVVECMVLALHVARAVGAKAWDLQLDRAIEERDLAPGQQRFGRVRTWLRRILTGS